MYCSESSGFLHGLYSWENWTFFGSFLKNLLKILKLFSFFFIIIINIIIILWVLARNWPENKAKLMKHNFC